MDQLKERVGKVDVETPLPTKGECKEYLEELNLTVPDKGKTIKETVVVHSNSYVITWRKRYGLKC